MAKKIRVAPASTVNWVTIPGNTADFSVEADMLDDTIFGHSYKSEQPDIKNWMMSSNAIYKGYSGYQAIVKKTGSSTVMTTEPMSLVSGKTYMITDAAKRMINVGVTVNVFDNAVNRNAEVETINFLFGKVTFKSSYTVTGPVTITGAYFPMSQICSMNKFTLTQQADAIDETDLCVAQSNSGFRQFTPGLKTVSLELSGFYKSSSSFYSAVLAGTRLMIELNPDGTGRSVAKGFFNPKSDKESGKVGALEEESVSFSLSVPDNDLMLFPFGWEHASNATLNTGIRTCLDAWQSDTLVEARYLEDGIAGKQGSAVVTNMSLSGGLGSLNEFSVQLKGSGGITTV